ncbi:RNA helicase [Malassezia brasiliensis]|uniref:RNA helicase n=1 Tax=Malassezia brasiliensis TaxID=1821822 RepID=A0AAF0ILX2_9BASI|nr:RNA helicase [Malassezia brasiliensis]
MDGAPKRRRAADEEEFVYTYDDDTYQPYIPVKQRKQQTIERLGLRARAPRKGPDEAEGGPPPPVHTLLHEAQELREKQRAQGHEPTQAEREAEEERKILEAHKTYRKLASHAELAQGIQYTEPLRRSWTPPRFVRARPAEQHDGIRQQYHILAEGDRIPPPIAHFRDMKLPPCILAYLAKKNIHTPSPIQIQGLPTVLSGRDMIGIAFTGSGKTITFTLPLVLFAAEAEARLPFNASDGPLGLILCPSRELARQTYDNVLAMADALEQAGYARVKALLCIGGISMSEQTHILRTGFHIVVATPGRLQDLLEQGRFTLASCNYVCLDEADRMMEGSFEENVRNILDFLQRQRQTLLFSATMPKKILDFAEQSLVQPVVVNVGRAGAASLDVIQEVEWVAPENKMAELLEALQKTAPPVIIFSDNKNEVDDILEFLLRKGVDAVSIHGSKTQEEREYAINTFKRGKRDVMVASGVASKGLDFSQIQHVINYTMPKDIEDYVHQIGRTGRSGKTGIATTFVNKGVPDPTLLDLKYLLMEAKQRIPPFLLEIEDTRASLGTHTGCAYCGGLGHTIKHCPKLEETQRRTTSHIGRDSGDY